MSYSLSVNQKVGGGLLPMTLYGVQRAALTPSNVENDVSLAVSRKSRM